MAEPKFDFPAELTNTFLNDSVDEFLKLGIKIKNENNEYNSLYDILKECSLILKEKNEK